MRKFLLLLLVVLMAAPLAFGQGFLQVSSLNGKPEIRSAAGGGFQPLTVNTRQVQVGDQIRTGPGESVVLTLPDASYMVVSENTNMVVQDFWSGGLRSTVNLMLGRVRFFINTLGGRPNPYRVQTPTALIAVRGTVFDVVVDDLRITEVFCLEGQVAVESAGLADREVILNPGLHTLVSPGRYPLPPVKNDVELVVDRTIKVVKQGSERENKALDPKGLERMIRDNDRMSRPSDRYSSPASQQSDSNVGRAKPSVTFP